MLYYRLVGSLAGISCIGSLLIILTFLMVKPIQKHPTRLILYLCVCDFFFSLKYVVTALYPDSSSLDQISGSKACITQAVFSQFFGLGTLGWIGMISINLVFNLRNPFVNTAGYEKWYHLWVWGYSLITTIILLVYKHDVIGEGGDRTCWIKLQSSSVENASKSKMNQYIWTVIIPMIAYFIIAIMALVYTQIRSRDYFQGQTKMARSIMIRMRIFVSLFIVLWLGTIVNRIVNSLWGTKPIEVDSSSSDKDPYVPPLEWWEGISVTIQGFANSIVWLTHPLIFKSFKNAFSCVLKPAIEKVPLINKVTEGIEDQEDIQKMDVIMRKSIVTHILLGLKHSLRVRGNSEDNYFYDYRPIYSSSADKKDVLRDLSESQANEATQVKVNYLFKDFEPLLCEELRKLDNISTEAYLKALHPQTFLGNLEGQAFSSGKGGAFFCFSPDKNFILKTIEASEAKILKRLLPDFRQHLYKYPNSYINKLYGFHSIKIHQLRIYVVIMSNVFNTKKVIHEKYDLKFSSINRYVKEHGVNRSVLGKDMNLQRKLKLTSHQKKAIIAQIEEDAKFLATLGIMDYSLLLGFHFSSPDSPVRELKLEITNENSSLKASEELGLENKGISSPDGSETYFMGIIDILQLYNLNKKTERFAKVHLLHQDKLGVSVQPVPVYLERFILRLQFIIEALDETSS